MIYIYRISFLSDTRDTHLIVPYINRILEKGDIIQISRNIYANVMDKHASETSKQHVFYMYSTAVSAVHYCKVHRYKHLKSILDSKQCIIRP